MAVRQPITYVLFQEKTVLIPLRYVHPECFLNIKDSPKLFPMQCFVEDACPPGTNCGEKLVKRVNYLFNEVVPDAEMLVSYFKWHDRPNSTRAAIFYRDLEPPKVGIINGYALRKFLREGTSYQWFPTDEYSFMGGSPGLIPVDSLIK